MEFQLLSWVAIQVFAFVIIVGGFTWYFLAHYKKNKSLPKKKTPYVLVGILAIVYSFGLIRINPPEVQQRVIKTFDTPKAVDIPEIPLQTKQLYQPTTEN